jgi:hypothetical protein
MGRPNKGAGNAGPKPPVNGPNDGTQYSLGGKSKTKTSKKK